MSEQAQGPGWWQASDERWYPPEQHPDAQGAAAQGAGPEPAGAAVDGRSPITRPPGGWGTGQAKLDLGTALSFGWSRFTQHVGQIALLILAMVVVIAIFMLGAAFVVAPAFDSFFLSFLAQMLVTFAGLAIAFILGRGLVRAILDICDGRPLDAKELFDLEAIGPYALTAILYIVIVSIGNALCYVPGLVAAVLLHFWAFAQVDGQLEPMDALKASFETVKNRVGEVLLLLVIIWIVNLVGALLCGLGLFVTIPVTMIATGYAWRVLNGRPPAMT